MDKPINHRCTPPHVPNEVERVPSNHFRQVVTYKYNKLIPQVLVVPTRNLASRKRLSLVIRPLRGVLARRLLVVAAESLVDGILDSAGEFVGHAHAFVLAAGDVLGVVLRLLGVGGGVV